MTKSNRITQIFAAIAALALAVTLSVAPAWGQQTPQLAFNPNGPSGNGGIISSGSPGYNGLSFDVSVNILGLNSNNVGNYVVEINGAYALPVLPPNGAAYATVPVQIGNSQMLENILKPITAKLYTSPQMKLVDVEKIVMYDLRGDNTASPGGGLMGRELAYQIMPPMIDKLEPVHSSSLPPGGDAAFEAAVTGPAENLEPSVTIPNGYFAADKVCFEVKDYKSVLTKTKAYNEALAEAWTAFTLYSTTPPFPGKNALACVKSIPQASKFIACVGKAKLEDASFGAPQIQNVGLELGANPNEFRASQISVGPIDGSADAILRDVAIIWDKGLPTCVGRPRATIDNSAYENDTELSNWATCSDLDLQINGASTGGGSDFTFGPGANPEEVEFTQLNQASFNLNGTSANVNKGLCGANPDLADEVEPLANAYFDSIRDNLEAFWASAGHDAALEDLFASIESGTHQINGFDINNSFIPLTSNQDIDNSGTTEVGMLAQMATSVATAGGGATSGFHADQRDDFFWDNDGMLPNGDPYDMWFGVTTNVLNQVVSPVGHSRLLFQYEPTWDEIGIDPLTVGYQETDPVPLNATILSGIDPSFQTLQGEIAITVTPTLQPFTWMHPDFNPLPAPGDSDMTYETGQVLVGVFEVDPLTKQSGTKLFEFAVDVIDPEFIVSLQTNPTSRGKHVLRGTFSAQKVTTFTMIDASKSDCFSTSCGVDAEVGYSALLTPYVEDVLLDVIAEVPAPSFWDANGTATFAKKLQEIHRYQGGQLLTFWGQLVDAP